MKSLSVIIFFVFLSLNLFASDIQAELQLISAPELLKEGDIVEGVLKVWPIEEMDPSEFKKLESMFLANSLYVSGVESVDVSANNADVVETKVLLIVKRSKENISSNLDYKGQMITIRMPQLKIEASSKEPEDYYIMNQGFVSSIMAKIIVLIILIALFLMAVWKRKYIKELIQKFKNDPVMVATKKYNKIFLETANREDYEKIYADRKDWLVLIKVQAPAYNEFFKTMEMHQYKEEWGAEELSEVRDSFDVIRGSFK